MAWSIGRPKLADLPVVTRLNAFDALARNSTILHISPDLLGSDDGNSPFLMQGPPQPNADAAGSPNFPSHLAPTALQKRVTHHPWLDLFPIPNMRDNILRGLEAGLLDEDELSDGLVCDLLNLEATSAASLVIWGDSWDIAGWEFSPAFFVKWAPLLRGCGEVLRATNYWRERRRAPRLEFVLD